MKVENDRLPNEEDYHFMKETIKRRPMDKGAAFRKIALAVGSGIIFGVCAAAALTLTLPVLGNILGKDKGNTQDVTLLTPAAQPDISAAPQEEPQKKREDFGEVSALDVYADLYAEVKEVAKEPIKSLVTVSGISDFSDLLDDSPLSYGEEEGIIFLENDTNLYILTNGSSFSKAGEIHITFADESIARGYLCRTNEETGLTVVRVPLEGVSRKTLKNISTARLGDSSIIKETDPIIVIGNVNGDHDAVMYGAVTSVKRSFLVSDAEYNLITTDMHGSESSGGVLLNTRGEVIGLILKQAGDEAGLIRALPITQLKSLIENLSNGKARKYLGIKGVSISEGKASALKIPRGIYVESVENESPAMEAGILSGDIITALDGMDLKDMQSYTAKLQKLRGGQRAAVTLVRQNSEGEYTEMELSVVIEQR